MATKHGIYAGHDWDGAHLSDDIGNTLDVESHVGRAFRAQRFYRTWPKVGVNPVEVDMAQRGRIPYVEIAPAADHPGLANWSIVASGKVDTYIHAQAQAYRAWWMSLAAPPAPRFYFVFQHEPDCDTKNGTPKQFKAAFKRFTNIWRVEGVPCLYVFNQTMSALNASATKWCPDPATFDLVGVDGYNKGPIAGARWRPFEVLFRHAYDFAVKLGKPLCIGEVGCAENPNDATGMTGISKAMWFIDEGETLAEWGNVEFVCYTHRISKEDYRVSTSPQAAEAFTALGHSTAMQG